MRPSRAGIFRLVALCALASATAKSVAAQERRERADARRRDSVAVMALPPLSVVGAVAPLGEVKVGSGVPARLSVLDAVALRESGASLLSAALSSEPGVTTYDDLGSPLKLTLVSRGFTASPVVGLSQGLSVFLDGVRVNEPEAAQVNFDLLPMEHVRRVELLSGTGTLLGRNSLGGAVNLVTARGDGPPGATLELLGGSFGALDVIASFAGGRPGRWDYYLGGGRQEEDGWRQVTSSERRNIFLHGGLGSARRGVRVQGFGAQALARTAGSLPESVFDTRPDSNLSADDYEDVDQLHLAMAAWADAGASRINATLFFRAHAAERFNRNQPDDPDVFGRSRNHSVGVAADVRRSFARAGVTGGLRAGIDAALTNVTIDIYRDSTKLGGSRDRSTLVRSPGHDLAAFAMGDVTRGRATLTGGLRLDHVRSPYENRLEPALDTVNTFTRLNVRAGVSVAATRGLSLFGSFGQSFRAPATLELACSEPTRPCPLPFALGDDPPLAPVVVHQYEVGGRWLARHALTSASLYRSDVRNDIYLLPSEVEVTGSSIDGYFANIARTRRQGFELDTRVTLPRNASLYGSWTYTRATFEVTEEIFSLRDVDDEEEEGGEGGDEATNVVHPGSRLPLVPDHVLKGGITVPAGGGLTLGVDARWVGERYLRGDEANETPPLSPYTIVDARASVRRGRWEVTVRLSNLFGTRYAAFGGYNVNQGNVAGPTLERFLTPGEPRRMRLGVRRSFGGAG